MNSLHQLKCCGIDDQRDWYRTAPLRPVPASCCRRSDCDPQIPEDLFDQVRPTSPLADRPAGTLSRLQTLASRVAWNEWSIPCGRCWCKRRSWPWWPWSSRPCRSPSCWPWPATSATCPPASTVPFEIGVRSIAK